jgi:hypothetical protein
LDRKVSPCLARRTTVQYANYQGLQISAGKGLYSLAGLWLLFRSVRLTLRASKALLRRRQWRQLFCGTQFIHHADVLVRGYFAFFTERGQVFLPGDAGKQVLTRGLIHK